MSAGAGCRPPPEVDNDVYECTLSSPEVGKVEPPRSLTYEASCKALRTKVVLEDVAVVVMTDVALATKDGLTEDTRAHETGRASLGSSPIVIDVGQTWAITGKVEAEPAFQNRSSAVPLQTRVELIARPTFPEDSRITDEDRERSPNHWKWRVVASSEPVGLVR